MEHIASCGLPFFGLSLVATCSRPVPDGVQPLKPKKGW